MLSYLQTLNKFIRNKCFQNEGYYTRVTYNGIKLLILCLSRSLTAFPLDSPLDTRGQLSFSYKVRITFCQIENPVFLNLICFLLTGEPWLSSNNGSVPYINFQLFYQFHALHIQWSILCTPSNWSILPSNLRQSLSFTISPHSPQQIVMQQKSPSMQLLRVALFTQ